MSAIWLMIVFKPIFGNGTSGKSSCHLRSSSVFISFEFFGSERLVAFITSRNNKSLMNTLGLPELLFDTKVTAFHLYFFEYNTGKNFVNIAIFLTIYRVHNSRIIFLRMISSLSNSVIISQSFSISRLSPPKRATSWAACGSFKMASAIIEASELPDELSE